MKKFRHQPGTEEGPRKRFTSNVQQRGREVTLSKLKFMGDTDGRGYGDSDRGHMRAGGTQPHQSLPQPHRR